MTSALPAPGGREGAIARMEASGLIAVIRVPGGEPDRLVRACAALRDGGVDVAEITMTSPGALEAIERARGELGDTALIGVGSVLDAETARAAIGAGAQFVISPVLSHEVIATAHRYGRPVIPGGMTPTEIISAWQAGAAMVKVFPANHFGPQFFKDLRGPMPQLKLTPTGGVNLDTAAEWLRAGAACLGVGSALVKRDLIENEDWTGLSELAGRFAEIVRTERDR